MKKKGVFNKLKKIVVVMMIFITMFFATPVKSKAAQGGLVVDFINLIMNIPDGVMHIIDGVMEGSREFTMEKVNLEGWDKKGKGTIYNFVVTPYEIFSSGCYKDYGNGYLETKIGWLDVNFFSDKEIISQNNSTEVSSNILKPVISNIYKSLRNLCMILMLLVILYIGIKILISSVSEQQAKYKRFLADWVVGFALLFAMHYIMSGIMAINSITVQILSNDEGDSYYVGVRELADWGYTGNNDSSWMDVIDGDKHDFGKNAVSFLINRVAVKDSSEEDETFNDDIVKFGKDTGRLNLKESNAVRYRGKPINKEKWGNDGVIYLSASLVNGKSGDRAKDNKAILKLNAMSYVRTIADFASEHSAHVIFYTAEGEEEAVVLQTAMGYSILYLAMVIQTIMFTFIYLKRVLQMAFLTMIAPIVAIMYPVDKLGDGKAQAFNTWFKDYLFNMLIQPMHLLLYTIFVVAAGQLISRNILYAIVIYAFMIPAEKYFKKLLGFEKASSGGGGPLGGAIGHGLAMEGLGKFAGIGPAAHKGGSGGSGKNGSNKKNRIRPRPFSRASGGGEVDTPSLGENSGRAEAGLRHASGIMPNDLTGQQNRNGNGENNTQNRASAGGGRLGKLGSGIKNRTKATASAAGKGISRAITGNKYDSLRKPGAKGEAASFLGRKVGRFVTRGAAKGIGMAAMGGVGLIAGAATAVATGDINNLWKGVSVGASSGNKMATNLYDGGKNLMDGFADAVKNERTKIDPEYHDKLVKENNYENIRNDDRFDSLTDEELGRVDTVMERMGDRTDIDNLGDVWAAEQLIKDNDGASKEELVKLYEDMEDYSNTETYVGKKLAKLEGENAIKESEVRNALAYGASEGYETKDELDEYYRRLADRKARYSRGQNVAELTDDENKFMAGYEILDSKNDTDKDRIMTSFDKILRDNNRIKEANKAKKNWKKK